MATPDRIAGDWGTSHSRLFLCAGHAVVERLRGPGLGPILKSGQDCGTVFQEVTQPWHQKHGPLPALLCGMVGSNLGWIDAGYVACPATRAQIAAAVARVDSRVSIVPGVAGQSLLGAPDVMRGEETQVLGAMSLCPALAEGTQWLCLPGTHSKWIRLEAGSIVAFQTVMTGEMFAILKDHSILLRAEPDGAAGPGSFLEGVSRAAESGGGAVTALMFETRSRQIRHHMRRVDAEAFLSGLLIGAEFAWAAGLGQGIGKVTLIGEPAMTQLYADAAGAFGLATAIVDGEAAVLAGLNTLGDCLR